MILFGSFVSIKMEVKNGYKGGGLVDVMYVLLYITLIIHFYEKNPNFLSTFVKIGLTPFTISFLFKLHFFQDFLYHLETQSNEQ